MSKVFSVFFWILVMAVGATPSFADGSGADSGGLIALGAGLGIGIAAMGVGVGQGLATAAAMESIGRNPNSADRIFVPMIIGLALMEALCLYALVIAFFLQGKIAS